MSIAAQKARRIRWRKLRDAQSVEATLRWQKWLRSEAEIDALDKLEGELWEVRYIASSGAVS